MHPYLEYHRYNDYTFLINLIIQNNTKDIKQLIRGSPEIASINFKSADQDIYDKFEVIDHLIKTDNIQEILELFVIRGDVESLQYLKERGAVPTTEILENSGLAITPEKIDFFLENGAEISLNALLSARNLIKNTKALMHYTLKGAVIKSSEIAGVKLEKIGDLMDIGIPLLNYDNNPITFTSPFEKIKYLIDHGVTISPESLEYVVKCADLESVFLVEELGIKKITVAALQTAIEVEDIDKLRYLSFKKDDKIEKTWHIVNNEHFLDFAAREGDLETTKRLIELGAQIGSSIYHNTIIGGNLELIKYLESLGIEPDDEKLSSAVHHEKLELAKYFIEEKGYEIDDHVINYLTGTNNPEFIYEVIKLKPESANAILKAVVKMRDEEVAIKLLEKWVPLYPDIVEDAFNSGKSKVILYSQRLQEKDIFKYQPHCEVIEKKLYEIECDGQKFEIMSYILDHWFGYFAHLQNGTTLEEIAEKYKEKYEEEYCNEVKSEEVDIIQMLLKWPH